MLKKLKKQVLIILLRHEKGEIPNVYKTFKKEIHKDLRDNGLSAWEIAYFVSWNKKVDKWKYERCLKSMKNEKLVKSRNSQLHRKLQKWKDEPLKVYSLTLEGKVKAEILKDEIIKYTEEWEKVLNKSPIN